VIDIRQTGKSPTEAHKIPCSRNFAKKNCGNVEAG
jgi:hypothetical protein